MQLAASCCSTGLRFLFHSLLLSAWSVLSSTALHHRRVIVECAKSILGAAGRLLRERRTKGRGDFRLFDARTLSPWLRPVHLEGDAPAACNMQPKRSKKKNTRPRWVPRMRSFYNAADFCCPFNSDFISHGIADSRRAARLAPSILRAFSVMKPRVSE